MEGVYEFQKQRKIFIKRTGAACLPRGSKFHKGSDGGNVSGAEEILFRKRGSGNHLAERHRELLQSDGEAIGATVGRIESVAKKPKKKTSGSCCVNEHLPDASYSKSFYFEFMVFFNSSSSQIL